MTLNPQNRGF